MMRLTLEQERDVLNQAILDARPVSFYALTLLQDRNTIVHDRWSYSPATGLVIPAEFWSEPLERRVSLAVAKPLPVNVRRTF
jgi:hypothetical protein